MLLYQHLYFQFKVRSILRHNPYVLSKTLNNLLDDFPEIVFSLKQIFLVACFPLLNILFSHYLLPANI